MKKLLLAISLVCLLISCTDQYNARMYGGTVNIELEENEEVLCATFKDSDIWITCRNTVTGEVYMRESSEYGINEGRVNFVKPNKNNKK